MCGGTLCTLLTEPDQCVFGLRTMTFYTIACFKLEFPVPTQKRLRVRFPSLVWTRADANPCSQVQTCGWESFPMSGGCYRSRC